MPHTTWRKLIDKVRHGDDITHCTLTEEELDVLFYDGYGASLGKPFVAWSSDWVYFPVVYDGAEWVGRVPRNPETEFIPCHFGGE